MTLDQLIVKIRDKVQQVDISGTEGGRIAVQCNLTGKVQGVFYVELLNGKISVMPYEYIDRDASISGALSTFEKIFTGKLTPQEALQQEKIKIEGNVDKVVALMSLLLS